MSRLILLLSCLIAAGCTLTTEQKAREQHAAMLKERTWMESFAPDWAEFVKKHDAYMLDTETARKAAEREAAAESPFRGPH